MNIPNNQELEEAVLGACMLEASALDTVGDQLNPNLFYQPKNKTICEAILSLLRDNNPVDIITVMNKVKEAYNGSADAYYITQLTNRVNQTSNIEFHITKLKELYIKREIIKIGQEAIKLGSDLENDCFDSLDTVSQRLLDLSNNGSNKGAVDIYTCYEDVVDNMEQIQNGNIEPSIKTGGHEFDQKIKIAKGQLVILAARPAMGKTAKMLNMAMGMAESGNVLINSMEMPSRQLTQRCVSAISGVELNKIKGGGLSSTDWERVANASGRFKNMKVFINEGTSNTVLGIKAKARQLIKKHGALSAIMIDYMQLMKDAGGGNREQEVARISRGLKEMALELDTPVIALSQLSRAVETRGGDKRPMLSDLRESGSIEQDADIVCFLYRPAYYNITEDEYGNSCENTIETIIAKQRDGALGSVYEDINLTIQKITEIEKVNEIEAPTPVNNSSLNKAGDSDYNWLD